MTEPENAPATSRIGTVISGRYKILELLGEGGMGAVYLAEHTAMRKRVALKLLHPEMSENAEVQSRFEREAMAASHVEHPNVAAATDFGRTEDGVYFLVLEYVEGTSLRDVLATGPLSVSRSLRIARQIALALERAHEAGIVHRDLKPENVMLVHRDEEPDFVKVLDFGIAKVLELGAAASHMAERQKSAQPLTRLGTILGTPEYMAPEQALGEAVTPASDLYAVGIMMFEMMSGLHPFDPPDRTAMLSFHIVAPVPKIEDRAPSVVVPPAVEAIVRRLLEKESKKRYSSARELVDALEQVEKNEAALDAPLPPASVRSAEVFAQTAVGTPPPSVEAYRDAAARDPAPPPSVGPTSTLDTLRAQPNRVKLAILAALPVGFVVILLVALLARGAKNTLVAVLDASADAAAPPSKVAPADRVKTAEALGPDALAALVAEFPDDPSLLPRLAVAQQSLGRTAEALETTRAAVKANTEAASDPALIELVTAAAAKGKGDDDDAAFALLEGPFGPYGVDALIEMSSGKVAALRPRAARSLAKPEVRAHASAAASAYLDLKAAQSCTAKHDVLARVKESGDARVAPALKSLKATRGCGFLGRGDCWGCLRRDTALEEAAAAVDARGDARANSPK